MSRSLARLLVATCFAVLLVASGAYAIEVRSETYTLPNGMTVILHEDHSLPQVVTNIWFAVGSKDEAKGRTGFAHLFEHLMFMGTARVPGSQFDVVMETGGGANNASTSTDRTNYFSWGPNELLPTLLWLDADRLEALGENMTREKLDLQRDVVRNERRQGVENTPYGISELIIAAALYPEGHPYQHSVIGSHEDLEAATVDDVKEFFATHYVPGNASLVVAGDFDPDAVKQVIAETFGAVPAQPVPAHNAPAPASLEREVRRVAVDDVEHAKLYLVWHSPAFFDEGDAEMDLIADILADGASSRLHERLVIEQPLAQEVVAYQQSKELESEFHIEVTARPGTDLELIKRITLDVVEGLKKDGPRPEELARVVASRESSFLRGMENLLSRADALNRYRHYFGTADGFNEDLARYTSADVGRVQKWAERVLGAGRLDLRILPEGARVEAGSLDERPGDFASREFKPPVPETFTLSNGIVVDALSRPGSGLFAGKLMVAGGERLIPVSDAGLGPLAATMLTSGANGKSATEFADAVAMLGADIDADVGRNHLTVDVRGLGSRIDATFDLFADTILRADLEQDDFERERRLTLDRINARADNPRVLGAIGSRTLLFGADDPRGRPVGGFASTVEQITLEKVRSSIPTLLNPAGARFVFVGDFTIDDLKRSLESRFGEWKSKAKPAPALPKPVTETARAKIFLIDRPGAPQTVIRLMRPVPPADEAERAKRDSLNTLFGGSFTSRLNQNLREKHGYTYGAGSAFQDDGSQFVLVASSAVQTAVTGPALTEFKKEFDLLNGGNVGEDELTKAVKTNRQNLVDTAGTTGSLLSTFSGLVMSNRPLDTVARSLEELAKVDLKGVNKAAGSGIYDWSKFQIVLVGDKEAVLPQLDEAGLPEPEIVPVDSLM